MPDFEIEMVRQSAIARLCAAGASPEEARIVVEHMITADLRGRPSHGLSIRYQYILRQTRSGAAEKTAQIVKDIGAALLLDGRDGLGYDAGWKCAGLLIERAAEHGVGGVNRPRD